MGDLVEYTSQPNKQLIFFKTTGYSITFSIKAFGNACIGLATEPVLDNISYWVYIGKNGKSGILENDNLLVEKETPDIINQNGYKNFWLTWYGKKLQFGKEGQTEAILSCQIKKMNFVYITFSEVDVQNAVYWKFMLPPKLERLALKPIEGGKPYWVPYDGLVPYGAVIGGFENEFLYVMRAKHEGSLTPGKFLPSAQCGFISWGGESHLKTQFEILCAHDCQWVYTQCDRVPVGAIEGGYTEHQGSETMYIGRVEWEDHLIPGKIAPSYKVCFFPYKEEEYSRDFYEILVAPCASARCNIKNFEGKQMEWSLDEDEESD